MRERYPPIEPNQTGQLIVSSVHTLYWEESGNPAGKPVIFLHGGPGSGTDPSHRCYFNPKKYRIILFDQRGCGKSTPYASLEENTTWDLVSDIEKLRVHLKISKWVVFGGSWGSTLALAYSQTHPTCVHAIVLRGIFMGTAQEIKWFYQFGAHHLYPDQFEKYESIIPESERSDFVKAYHKRLTSPDADVRKQAARAWATWEGSTLRLLFDPSAFETFTEDHKAEAIARIECHYFINQCFFETDTWLLDHVDSIRSIPTTIVHGRYDIICPFESAWRLSKAWPEAKLEIIPNAGHSATELGITDALVRATDLYG
jgi:proline iminopeptidase